MTTEPQLSLTKKEDIAVLGGFILTLCFGLVFMAISYQYRSQTDLVVRPLLFLSFFLSDFCLPLPRF